MQQLVGKIASSPYLLLSLATLFWAGNFIVGRGMHDHIPPLAMATMRWMIAATLFFPFALKYVKKDWPVIKENFGIILVLGILGVGCFNSFAYIGLNHTTALNGLIIQSAGPVTIMLVALLLFGDRIRARQLLGVMISLMGVLVIVSKMQIDNLINLQINRGDLWIVGAVIVWALYTVLLRKRPDIHPMSFIMVTFIIGALANLPFFLFENAYVRQLEVSRENMLAIAYISVFPSILSYLFWNRGVALIGSNRAGTFLHLMPLFGSAMAILFLGEQLAPYHALGLVMIIAGVTLAIKS